MSDFPIGGGIPKGKVSPLTPSSLTPESLDTWVGDRCPLPSRFDISFSRITDLLLSHLDLDAVKPQRNLDLIKTAVNNFKTEMASVEHPPEPGSMLSKLSTMLGGDSVRATDEYHAISRLYGTIYSQFPDEASLHIDHEQIDQLNHDLWNGGRVSRQEVNSLTHKLRQLLGELGV